MKNQVETENKVGSDGIWASDCRSVLSYWPRKAGSQARISHKDVRHQRYRIEHIMDVGYGGYETDIWMWGMGGDIP